MWQKDEKRQINEWTEPKAAVVEELGVLSARLCVVSNVIIGKQSWTWTSVQGSWQTKQSQQDLQIYDPWSMICTTTDTDTVWSLKRSNSDT